MSRTSGIKYEPRTWFKPVLHLRDPNPLPTGSGAVECNTNKVNPELRQIEN